MRLLGMKDVLEKFAKARSLVMDPRDIRVEKGNAGMLPPQQHRVAPREVDRLFLVSR